MMGDYELPITVVEGWPENAITVFDSITGERIGTIINVESEAHDE